KYTNENVKLYTHFLPYNNYYHLRYNRSVTSFCNVQKYHQRRHYMKRFIAALFAVALIISPIGSYVFPDDLTTVEAKRYMSGKKSFNMPKNRPNQSNFQKKQNQQPSKHNATTKQQNSKGGF